MINGRIFIIAGSLALAASAAQEATAGQIGLEFLGRGAGRAVEYRFVSRNLEFTDRAFAGQRIWQVTQGDGYVSGGMQIKTFSADIFENTRSGDFTLRNVDNISNWDRPVRIGPAATSMLEHLYAMRYDRVQRASRRGNDRAAEAFQVAIWEIASERRTNFDLDRGRFRIIAMSGGAKRAATRWLSETLAAFDNDELQQFELFGALGDQAENQLAVIPAPAPILLAGAGLIAVGALRRRLAGTSGEPADANDECADPRM